jgi:uncharacterized protein
VLQSDHAHVAAALVAAFGPHVSLISVAPAGLMLEFAAGTLGGKHAETTEIPVAGAAPPGALFDYASIHIITTSTLRSFETAYPQGQFAIARFRPNLVVECPDESGFVENAWVGRILAIGPELRLRVSIPCPRCVMTTLPRVDLPLASAVLRTVAQLNKLNLGDFGDLPCAGVYADVITPGRIRRHEAVRLVD